MLINTMLIKKHVLCLETVVRRRETTESREGVSFAKCVFVLRFVVIKIVVDIG